MSQSRKKKVRSVKKKKARKIEYRYTTHVEFEPWTVFKYGIVWSCRVFKGNPHTGTVRYSLGSANSFYLSFTKINNNHYMRMGLYNYVAI